MAADTFSTGLGYLTMATGNDNNAWGDNANNFVFKILEDAICGQLTLTTTGGTIDLSAAPPPAGASAARYNTIYLTGAMTSSVTIIVPNLPKTWVIYNGCTGQNFVGTNILMKVKTPSGTGVLVPQGSGWRFTCLGSDLIFRENAQTGNIFSHGGTTAPPGAAACDGSAFNRADTNELFGKLSTTWGAGNGTTTYLIPDTQTANRFLRSSSAGLPVGTIQVAAFVDHTHTTTMTSSGTSGTESAGHVHQIFGSTGAESNGHTHTVTAMQQVTTAVISGGGAFLGSNTTITTSDVSAAHSHFMNFNSQTESASHTHALSVSGTAASGGASTGSGAETRPNNAAVLMCVWL